MDAKFLSRKVFQFGSGKLLSARLVLNSRLKKFQLEFNRSNLLSAVKFSRMSSVCV